MSDPFSEISEAWFREYGTTDPVEAFVRWSQWLQQHPDAKRIQKLKKVALLATPLKDISIRNWLHKDRYYRVGKEKRVTLDAIACALKCEDYVIRKAPVEPIQPLRSGNRIAVLTRLARLPSLSYHMDVIRGLVRAAEEHLFLPTVHEVREEDLARTVTRVLRVLRPNALVMVRLTPPSLVLDLLKEYEVPVVLVHADRLKYPYPPALANVVPDQEKIGEQLLTALKACGFPGSGGRQQEVVMVAMKEEETVHEFEVAVPFSPSIRNRRIELLKAALKPFNPIRETVHDYSFRHAAHVLKDHSHARVFVCLCDPLAVAIKQLLAAAGQDVGRIVVGFDHSELARQAALPSFCQGLNTIGPLAINVLASWFAQAWDSSPPQLPATEKFNFHEISVKVELKSGE